MMTARPGSGTTMAWTTLLDQGARNSRAFGVLDVGSHKLCCYIARIDGRGRLDLLGAAHQAADGFAGGEVVDAAAAEAAIRSVVDVAEQDAQERLDEITVVFAGGELSSGYVRVEVGLDGQPVRRRDVLMALAHAADHAPADGFAIAHALPLGESIDRGPEVRDSTGLPGKRLTVRTHLVGVRRRPLDQLAVCLERGHLRLATIYAAPYASALACLTKDEAERGAMVVDLGARTTTLAVLQHGRLQYVAAVPQGGDHLTDELAHRLAIPRTTAERIKNIETSVVWRSCDSFQTIELTPLGAERGDVIEVPRRRLFDLLRPLAEALMGAVVEQLRQAPEAVRGAARRGVVLTGGGAQQDGMVELAAEMLGGGARLGRPAVLDGWVEPQMAAASGGLALAAGADGGIGYVPSKAVAGPLGKPFESLGRWLRESLGVA